MSDNSNENVYVIVSNESSIYRNQYSSYKCGAKRRGHGFNISESFFVEIVNGNCHYCGKEPELKQFKRSSDHHGRVLHGNPIKFQGVDRVDNNIGYTPDNVVPCCKKCNYMKHTLNADDFIDHVLKIAEHIKIN